jgi:hypothetical protein
MNEIFYGTVALKRLLAAACVVLAAVTCGGDDGNGDAGSSGGGGQGGTSGSGAGAEPGGAGGSDGHGGAGGAPTSHSGVVAGYLRGATVFLDLNEDFVHDSNEPSATTRSDGSFELELSGDIDPGSFPVVVLVPDTAIDSYTGEAVVDPYVLAAPAGANTFVSPLSSLVMGLLARYPSFSLEEAEASILSKLAVGDGKSLFSDYVADSASSSSTAAESQKLHRAARVVAMSFGIDLRQIDSSTTTRAEAVDAFTLVTHNAESQLATIASAVGADLDNDHLLTVAAFLKHVETASLDERLDKSRRAVRADFFDTFADGAYLAFPGPNGAVVGYGTLRPTSTDRDDYSLPQQDYVWDNDTETYVPEPRELDTGYNLTAGGWVVRTEANSDPSFASNADGSADRTGELMRSAQRATSNAVDLSGRLMRSYAKGIDFADRDARFPSGAVGYRLALNARSDEYEASEDDTYNPGLFDLTTLDDVETAYGPNGAFLRTSTALNLMLMSGGVVLFSSGRDEMSLPLAGTWRRRVVEGVELIEIEIPVAYKAEFDFSDPTSDLIIAIIDGHARRGTVTPAGIADTQDYYVLDETAFDAVVAAAVAYDDGTYVFGQVAAEGYLEGATVFLDLDDDGVLDAGEPASTSDESGAYMLFWSERDVAAHSIAAIVPATAFRPFARRGWKLQRHPAFLAASSPGRDLRHALHDIGVVPARDQPRHHVRGGVGRAFHDRRRHGIGRGLRERRRRRANQGPSGSRHGGGEIEGSAGTAAFDIDRRSHRRAKSGRARRLSVDRRHDLRNVAGDRQWRGSTARCSGAACRRHTRRCHRSQRLLRPRRSDLHRDSLGVDRSLLQRNQNRPRRRRRRSGRRCPRGNSVRRLVLGARHSLRDQGIVRRLLRPLA